VSLGSKKLNGTFLIITVVAGLISTAPLKGLETIILRQHQLLLVITGCSEFNYFRGKKYFLPDLDSHM
jgi:hypothetical protein